MSKAAAGWQTKQLGDIAQVKGGKRVPKGYKLETEPTNHPYLTVSSFTDDGTIDTSELRYISPEVFAQIDRYTISSEDLFVSIAGTIGKAGSVPPELDGANLTENACKLVFNPGICRDFVYYFTKSTDFALQAATNTRVAAQPKLALERLKTIALAVPHRAEQKRIVGILDEAFDGIATAKANAEKNLQNARALFESHLQSVFTRRGEGWVEKPLVSLCPVFVDSAHRTPNYQTEGIPALRPRDVVNGRLALTEVARVSEEEYEIQSRRHRPAPGDVVYSRELSYGWAAALPESPRVCLSQGMCLFRPSVDLDSAFLLYVLNGPIGREQATRVAVGAAHPHINLGDIQAYRIPFPSFREQKQITQRLDALRAETQRLESIYRQKLAALEALKKSLLDQAFNGVL